MNTILKVENLEKYYGSKGNITKAVDNISFEIAEGEYVGIMGASGSGKTTLLNCVSTIDTATSGHIYVDGKDVTSMKAAALSQFRREKLGFVFQDFNLLDTLTAFENIALALTITKTPTDQIDKQVRQIAELLDITDILKNTVSNLWRSKTKGCGGSCNHHKSKSDFSRRTDRRFGFKISPYAA